MSAQVLFGYRTEENAFFSALLFVLDARCDGCLSFAAALRVTAVAVSATSFWLSWFQEFGAVVVPYPVWIPAVGIWSVWCIADDEIIICVLQAQSIHFFDNVMVSVVFVANGAFIFTTMSLHPEFLKVRAV